MKRHFLILTLENCFLVE